MTPEEVAARFDDRDGYRIVAYREVGLPVYAVTMQAMVIAKRKLGTIEEFTLRSIDAGLSAASDIEAFLGLPNEVVEATVAELIQRGDVEPKRRSPAGLSLVLSEKGKRTVRAEEISRPSVQTLTVFFDGLLRMPRWIGPIRPQTPQELRRFGIVEVRAFPARGPAVEEMTLRETASALRLARRPEGADLEVLRILSVERRQRMYRAAVALVYKSGQSSDVRVAFAIDGRLSEEHAVAFEKARGLERALLFSSDGLQSAPGWSDTLPEDLASLVEEAATQDSTPSIVAARSRATSARLAIAEANSAAARASATEGHERAIAAVEQAQTEATKARARRLAIYEHIPLLDASVAAAASRLVVISGTIGRAMLDQSFLLKLRQACVRGVEVWLGYGTVADGGALRDLASLAKDFPRLVVKELPDTQGRVLIQDSEILALTSFDWLSFRGSADRSLREEWGVVITDPAVVDRIFVRARTRFE